MMKKILVLTMLAVFTITTFAYPPAGKRAKRQHRNIRGAMKTLIFFKTVKDSREKLNLTEKQNVQLDKILRDVEGYTKKLKEERKKDNFADQFISDSFDPFKMEQQQQKKREKNKIFYLSKVKAIHDLLTKEQRKTLVSIIKAKTQRMRKLRRKM